MPALSASGRPERFARGVTVVVDWRNACCEGRQQPEAAGSVRAAPSPIFRHFRHKWRMTRNYFVCPQSYLSISGNCDRLRINNQ